LSDRQKGDPTPAQIRRMCKAIRSKWTPHELWVKSDGRDGQPNEETDAQRPTILPTMNFDDLFGTDEQCS